jgi:hypothetical protein
MKKKKKNIGEVWRRAIAKCVLHVAGTEAKEACGTDQLCAGLEAGVEGAIHAMQHVWAMHAEEEEWGFLLVDARNAFNELNRTAMLWTVRHEWPSGARFAFNCYRHHSTLMIRHNNGTGVTIPSREGVTQGDPLAMVLYGLAVLPLVRQLKREFPLVEQPWYADDAAAGGQFSALHKQFRRLQELGPSFGYFAEPSKSFLIVQPQQLDRAKAFFKDMAITVETGHRYLGSYIGDQGPLDVWLRSKVHTWAEAVKALARVAKTHPQSAYSALQRALQQEWQFVQRVVQGCGASFEELKAAIDDQFLPALFDEPLDPDDPTDPRLDLSRLPVKQAGLAIADPTASADENYLSSTVLCSHIRAALLGDKEFSSADHASAIKAARREMRERKSLLDAEKLRKILLRQSPENARVVARGTETGGWLQAPPSHANGTGLSKDEFRVGLFNHFGRSIEDMPAKCDGCGANFDIRHALSCHVAGLPNQRHNEVRDELGDLAARAFVPTSIRSEPKIHTSYNRTATSAQDSNERGDLLIRGLWSLGTDCILDVRVSDIDAKSYLSQPPAKVLEAQEKLKTKKYAQACADQRRHFTPFVASTDGMLGRQAQTVLVRLATLISKKSGKPYSKVCSFVRTRMSFAILRATHLCIRGSRVPTSRMSQRVQWTDGAGLTLFRT